MTLIDRFLNDLRGEKPKPPSRCPTCGINWNVCRDMVQEAKRGEPNARANIDALEIITANCASCYKELKGEAIDRKIKVAN